MGVCVETLKVACEKELHELANTINGELKAEASKGAGKARGKYATGAAVGAIHIEMGTVSAFVGGTGGEGTKHLFWLDEGNGGRRIYAKGRALGKYPGGIPGIGWRKSVSSYSGTHFVRRVADRHR